MLRHVGAPRRGVHVVPLHALKGVPHRLPGVHAAHLEPRAAVRQEVPARGREGLDLALQPQLGGVRVQ